MTNQHSDLCRKLRAFEPGILPNDVFHAVVRLVVLPTFVVIPTVRQGDRTIVSLRVRDVLHPYSASAELLPNATSRRLRNTLFPRDGMNSVPEQARSVRANGPIVSLHNL